MDEPTNHLDIAGKETLEYALKEFNGAIIVVSHDRFFLDRIVDRLLVVGVDSLGKRSFGECEMVEAEKKVYSRYAEMLKERKAVAEAGKAKTSAAKKHKRSKDAKPKASKEIRKFNKYRIEQIEEMIMELEDQIPGLEAGFAEERIYKDHKLSAELHEKVNSAKERLDLLYEVYEHKSK